MDITIEHQVKSLEALKEDNDALNTQLTNLQVKHDTLVSQFDKEGNEHNMELEQVQNDMLSDLSLYKDQASDLQVLLKEK